jgi:hypothetical protein
MSGKKDNNFIPSIDFAVKRFCDPDHPTVIQISVQVHLKASRAKLRSHGDRIISSLLQFADVQVIVIANDQRKSLGLHGHCHQAQ